MYIFYTQYNIIDLVTLWLSSSKKDMPYFWSCIVSLSCAPCTVHSTPTTIYLNCNWNMGHVSDSYLNKKFKCMWIVFVYVYVYVPWANFSSRLPQPYASITTTTFPNHHLTLPIHQPTVYQFPSFNLQNIITNITCITYVLILFRIQKFSNVDLQHVFKCTNTVYHECI